MGRNFRCNMPNQWIVISKREFGFERTQKPLQVVDQILNKWFIGLIACKFLLQRETRSNKVHTLKKFQTSVSWWFACKNASTHGPVLGLTALAINCWRPYSDTCLRDAVTEAKPDKQVLNFAWSLGVILFAPRALTMSSSRPRLITLMNSKLASELFRWAFEVKSLDYLKSNFAL